MRQTWADIVWCHWPVEPERIAAILPDGLTPDLFEGQAWIGLIPFSMQRLRAHWPLGWVTRVVRSANFGEVNVRTYVVGPDGQRGVWFCTLDADSYAAVATARLAFGLPYRVSRSQFSETATTRHWSSRRRRDGATSLLQVEIADELPRPAAPGLESFLVERYALYTSWHGQIVRGELAHEPWRVRSGRVLDVDTSTVAAAGIDVSGEPHVLVGEGVDVSVFMMHRSVRSR
jgi:uncharacterized protein YqjF (DUF2071 family)